MSDGHAMSEEVTPAQRRADALALLAEAALAGDLDRGTAGDRYQVVMHVDGAEDAGAVLELDHGVQRVSAETSRRLSCDASVVMTSGDGDGPNDVTSRRTRTIPAAVRRALAARDRTCRFPGCTSRRCDAHHIEHWADGGESRVPNLVLLCRRHHRAVHEGGFDVTVGDGGALEFWRPQGARLRATPDRSAPMDIAIADPPRAWDGTPFDVAYALDVVWRAADRRAWVTRPSPPAP